jgi:hypothetical protein
VVRVVTDTHSTGPAGDARTAPPDDAPETPGERRLVSLLIAGIILLIFGAAFWLGDALLDARRADECIASGRRNCAPISAPTPPPR